MATSLSLDGAGDLDLLLSGSLLLLVAAFFLVLFDADEDFVGAFFLLLRFGAPGHFLMRSSSRITFSGGGDEHRDEDMLLLEIDQI